MLPARPTRRCGPRPPARAWSSSTVGSTTSRRSTSTSPTARCGRSSTCAPSVTGASPTSADLRPRGPTPAARGPARGPRPVPGRRARRARRVPPAGRGRRRGRGPRGRERRDRGPHPQRPRRRRPRRAPARSRAGRPGHLSVVGFDDTFVATLVSPALTSVRADLRAMGAAAVDLLVGLLTGSQVPDGAARPGVRLPVELVVRGPRGSHRTRPEPSPARGLAPPDPRPGATAHEHDRGMHRAGAPATSGRARPASRAWGGRPAGVQGPAVEPTTVGIVHLGIGAFHRAHQAVLTEDAAALTGETRWGSSVSRSARALSWSSCVRRAASTVS
ncbi:substrate-binding domain-containing protein [Oerskovia sp. M15]